MVDTAGEPSAARGWASVRGGAGRSGGRRLVRSLPNPRPSLTCASSDRRREPAWSRLLSSRRLRHGERARGRADPSRPGAAGPGRSHPRRVRDVEVEIRREGRGARLPWPTAVQGKRGDRFIYLTWGEVGAGGRIRDVPAGQADARSSRARTSSSQRSLTGRLEVRLSTSPVTMAGPGALASILRLSCGPSRNRSQDQRVATGHRDRT